MTVRFATAVCFAGVLLSSGCGAAGYQRAVAAGETGCTADEIEILGSSEGSGPGAWVAECRQQQYVCSNNSCTLRQERAEAGPRVEDVRRERTIAPGQGLTFATSDGDIRAARATLVTVDSEMSLTVGPDRTDEVSVEVRSSTRVPLSACEDLSFQRGETIESESLVDGRAQFPLATLSRIFSLGPERKSAHFCGRVILIGPHEQELFARLEESIARIGSADTSGGEQVDGVGGEETNDPSTTIRARLDAESPTLHACAGQVGPLRVLAAWNEEGGVTVTVDGAGDAINECIRTGILWTTLEAPAPGSLIHVVRPTPEGT